MGCVRGLGYGVCVKGVGIWGCEGVGIWGVCEGGGDMGCV